MSRTVAIFVTADSDIDREGDEFQVWHVGPGDEDGEPTGKHYTCHSYDKAFNLGRKMAADRRLELVID